MRLPQWRVSQESACQWRRHKRCRFNPWARKTPWRRKWQPVPVILHGKSHGQRSLVGFSPWGCKESDATEQQRRYHRETFVIINWYDLKFDKVVNLVPHEWKGKKKIEKKWDLLFWLEFLRTQNEHRHIFSKSLRIFLKIFRVTSCFRWGGIEENVACN